MAETRGRHLTGIAAAAIILGTLAAGPAAGQTTVYAAVGKAFYSAADPLCPPPNPSVTTYRVGLQTARFGGTIGYNYEDYPWPEGEQAPTAPQQTAILNHGPAVQLAAELYPLGFLRGEGAARTREWARPFLGLGLQRTADGEPAASGPGQGFDTNAIRGRTDLLVTYGALLYIPAAGSFSVVIELRGNSVFSGSFEEVGPSGLATTLDGKTLTWGEWLLGVSYRLP